MQQYLLQKFPLLQKLSLPLLFSFSLYLSFFLIPIHTDNTFCFLLSIALAVALLLKRKKENVKSAFLAGDSLSKTNAHSFANSLSRQDAVPSKTNHSTKEQKSRCKIQIAYLAFFAYMATAILSSLLTIESAHSIPRLFLWMLCLLLGYLIVRVYRNYNFSCVYGSILSILLSAALGFVYWLQGNNAIFHDERLKLFSLHPSRLALYLSMILLFCLCHFILSTKRKLSFFSLVIMIFSLVLFFLTNTRAMIFLLPVGLLSLLVSLHKHITKKVYLSLFFALLLFLVLAWLNKDSFTGQRLINAAKNFSQEATFQTRIPIWLIALEKIQEKPLLGHGLQSYRRLYSQYLAEHETEIASRFALYDKSAKTAHNIILGRLVDTGILGTLFFFLFYLIALYRAFSGPEQTRWIGAFLLYFFCIGQLDDPLSRVNDSFILILASAALAQNVLSKTALQKSNEIREREAR